MFNYVRDFVPNMSAATAPLRNLLKKDVIFQWLPAHDEAFKNLKNLIANSPILTNFNEKLPIEIQCDSSKAGLGSVLLQKKRPVAFASASLTPAECNYSQSEKELRAVDFSMKKFHNYVYGHDVLVKTDHKPLVPIMYKPIDKIGSSVLRRIRLKLLKYKIKLEYLPGKQMFMADQLSRSYLPKHTTDGEYATEIVHSLVKHLPMSEKRKLQFLSETEADEELKTLKSLYLNGWPDHKKQVPELVKWAWPNRDDFYVDSGLMFYNQRLCVPVKLKKDILSLLHQAHLGRDKTVAKAQEVYYWRNMYVDISNMVSNCYVCQKFQPMKSKAKMELPPVPNFRFETVGIDILQTMGKNYLILIDTFSKWIEICPIRNKTAATAIEHLKSIFATFGIPKYIQADNMPFQSQTFVDFANDLEIKILPCSPRYHQGNPSAEKACAIAENILKKSAEEKRDFRELLLEYRNAPIPRLGSSPSQILMSRSLRTSLPVPMSNLEPKIIQRIRPKMIENQAKAKLNYDKTARRNPDNFQTGTQVLVKTNKNENWRPAKVVEKYTTPRSYIVQYPNGTKVRRNEAHIKKFSGRLPRSEDEMSIDFNWCEKSTANNVSEDQPGETTEIASQDVTSSSESEPESEPATPSNCSFIQENQSSSSFKAESPEVIELDQVPSTSSQSLEDIIGFSVADFQETSYQIKPQCDVKPTQGRGRAKKQETKSGREVKTPSRFLD